MSSSARSRYSGVGPVLLYALFAAPGHAAEAPPPHGTGRSSLPPQTAPLRSSPSGDYGRLDGALDLELSALGHIARDRALQVGLRAGAEYFSTAGLWFNGSLSGGGDPAHRLAAGLSLKPIFLPRWALDIHHNRATPDLILDSLSLDLGAFTENANSTPQRGLLLGIGVGIPLLGSAAGPWLGIRGLLQWPDDLAKSSTSAIQLSLGWHWLLEPLLL